MTGASVNRPSRNKGWNVQGIRFNVMVGDDKKYTPKCAGCKYRDAYGDCVYILIEGHSRGVPMGKGGGCSLKTNSTRPRSDNFIFSDAQKKMAHENKGWEFDTEEAARLYNIGDGDLLIANRLGVKKQSICDWRKATGRPSNQLKRRKEE